MKRILTLAFICLLIFPCDAFPQTQRRRRGTTRTRRPATTRPSRTPTGDARRSAEQLSAARTRIVEQIKLLTRFLYVFGRVSNNIEMSETDRRAGNVTSEARDSLRENLANVRAGLVQMENDFRANPELAGFYIRVTGVSDLTARAEGSAAANRLDEAGRTMIEVVHRLTDALREER